MLYGSGFTNTFDLIKVSTFHYDRKTLDLSNLEETVRKVKGSATKLLSLTNRPNGLIDFSFDEYTHKFIMEFSSKILGSRYKELINFSNISYIVDIINDIGVVKIYKDQFIDFAEVLKCHVTKDVHLDYPAKQYITLLPTCEIDSKYDCRTEKRYGLFFKPKAKSNKVVSKIYDKLEELEKNKTTANQRLLPLINLADFHNRARVELQLCDFKAIRKYLGLPEGEVPYIRNVLSAKKDALADIFRELIIKPNDPSKVVKTGLTFKEECYSDKFEEFYSLFGNDDFKALEFFKAKYPKEAYVVKRKFLAWKAHKLITPVSYIRINEFFEKVGII
ncbi:MAG: hypothetical protein FD122_1345 [Stygiobacter sp.]|nr:MAG: hypothetical protein FD122_1345 [Stygiobacter sp.]KAF0218010.1 MAG: hypothetical protein FD178_244 [Ignavibacteria bacterium]